MYYTLYVLFALVATSISRNLPQRLLEQREGRLNTGPGCISYMDPHVALENQQNVLESYSEGSLASSQQELTDCLNEYGCGNFSNSWSGNVCGGRGWFKGPPSSTWSSSSCFQHLAPWVLLDGIMMKNAYYKAVLGRHDCYMGFNEPESKN